MTENGNNAKSNVEKKPNSLLSILGNAMNSTQQFKQTEPGLETITCGSCGAARPAETNLQTCDYCGYKFY